MITKYIRIIEDSNY